MADSKTRRRADSERRRFIGCSPTDGILLTVYVKHTGADMRLHRARQVLRQVVTLEQDYLGSGAVRIEDDPGPEGTRSWRVRIDEEPPAELARLTLAAVGTAREALDDLAVSLAVASRRTPRDTTFPIAESARAYADVERQCLRHTSPAARRAVQAVTPWRGADDLLWELHAVADAGAPPSVRVGEVLAGTTVRVPSVLHVLPPDERAGESCRPLRDQSPLAGAARLGGAPPANPHEAGIRVVLASGSLLRGRPLAAGVDLLVTHAAEVVQRVVRVAEQR